MVLPPRFGGPANLLFHAQSQLMFSVLIGTDAAYRVRHAFAECPEVTSKELNEKEH
jgi:hypothetical protein